MDNLITKKQVAFLFAIFISLLTLAGFLYITGIILQPLVLIIISLFVIVPFTKDSPFAKRLLVMISLLFVGWLLADLGFAVIPFLVAFLMAYLLDPFVVSLEKIRIPRWLSALIIDLTLVGGVTVISIFVFPLIYDQLDDAINRISLFITNLSKDLDSNAFYNFMSDLGLKKATTKAIVQNEIIPRIEPIISGILGSLLNLVTNISALATSIFNIILIPVLFFYFLKDYRKIVVLLKAILIKKNTKLLKDLRRISRILKKYVSWQITAAFIIASVCSTFFSIFKIPYPIVLGILCGILNPIPYLGIFASMIISIITIIIVNQPDMVSQILAVVAAISAMHFINAYFLEPNIAGKMIGLHPALLIASLFVFGGMFGFFGLLIAVPLTATLVMFFDDWLKKNINISLLKE
ncbi:MAG: AI-2E family transporter [bacterium]